MANSLGDNASYRDIFLRSVTDWNLTRDESRPPKRGHRSLRFRLVRIVNEKGRYHAVQVRMEFAFFIPPLASSSSDSSIQSARMVRSARL